LVINSASGAAYGRSPIRRLTIRQWLGVGHSAKRSANLDSDFHAELHNTIETILRIPKAGLCAAVSGHWIPDANLA
jgi:hypothetical protein